MSSQVKPSAFAIAAEQYKPICASFAAGIVSRRNFMDPRYMNRELMTNEITMILSQWFAAEITTLVTRFLSTIKQEDRNAFLSQVVREDLQQPVARSLCPLHDRFRGQDDGLFDMTATDTYKALHWDLVECLIEMIGMYGASVVENW
jgi:hypothetical protein